jgi:hypothetical protein
MGDNQQSIWHKTRLKWKIYILIVLISGIGVIRNGITFYFWLVVSFFLLMFLLIPDTVKMKHKFKPKTYPMFNAILYLIFSLGLLLCGVFVEGNPKNNYWYYGAIITGALGLYRIWRAWRRSH